MIFKWTVYYLLKWIKFSVKKNKTLKNTGKWQKILEKSGSFVSPEKWEPWSNKEKPDVWFAHICQWLPPRLIKPSWLPAVNKFYSFADLFLSKFRIPNICVACEHHVYCNHVWSTFHCHFNILYLYHQCILLVCWTWTTYFLTVKPLEKWIVIVCTPSAVQIHTRFTCTTVAFGFLVQSESRNWTVVSLIFNGFAPDCQTLIKGKCTIQSRCQCTSTISNRILDHPVLIERVPALNSMLPSHGSWILIFCHCGIIF